MAASPRKPPSWRRPSRSSKQQERPLCACSPEPGSFEPRGRKMSPLHSRRRPVTGFIVHRQTPEHGQRARVMDHLSPMHADPYMIMTGRGHGRLNQDRLPLPLGRRLRAANRKTLDGSPRPCWSDSRGRARDARETKTRGWAPYRAGRSTPSAGPPSRCLGRHSGRAARGPG